MRLGKLVRTYGPTLRWRTFRLYGEPPTGKWMRMRVTQLVGGKSWSLAITRTGATQRDDHAEAP